MRSSFKSIDGQPTEHPEYSLGSLRRCPLFTHLSATEIEFFHDASQVRSYKKGKILYLQDNAADFFYVVCSGWIKLFHTLPEGDEVIIDMLTTGDMVGESAIFENGFHTSSSQIVEDVQLLCMPSSVLKSQIQNNPTIALAMISSLSIHHRRHYGEIALNIMQNAPQRIGCFLLRLCPIDQKKNVVLQLPYDKTLIAYTLGMKGATFSRALNILRMKTNLRVINNQVEIDSVPLLAKFVYGPLASKYITDHD